MGSPGPTGGGSPGSGSGSAGCGGSVFGLRLIKGFLSKIFRRRRAVKLKDRIVTASSISRNVCDVRAGMMTGMLVQTFRERFASRRERLAKRCERLANGRESVP
jgi:hypothetical protein